MADHTVNVGVVVDVKGEEKLAALSKRLEAANKKIQSTTQQSASSIKDSTLSFAERQDAIAKRRVAAALAEKSAVKEVTTSIKEATQAVSAKERASKSAAVKDLFSQAKGEKIGSAIGGAVGAVGTEVGAFAQFSAGVAGNAIKIAAVGAAMGVVAVAAVAATAALHVFSGAIALMKNSFKWAGEAADQQIDTFARMKKNRTTWAEETSRFMAGTELIGKNFESLNDKISDKSFAKTDFAKNWGMDKGQLDKFGATQHEAQGAAPFRTRQADSLDILQKAVAKREELEKRLDDAIKKGGKDSPAAKAAMTKQRQFFKDIASFDEGFAKIASVASKSDIAAMMKTTNEIAAMYKVPANASAALGYKRAIMEFNAIWDMLKFNIGSAAMPGITTAVKGISESLKSIAPALGNLGGALVGKGWEVIGDVTQKLAGLAGLQGGTIGETLDKIADAIRKYPTEDISEQIIKGAGALRDLGDAAITIAGAIKSAAETIKAAKDALTPPKPDESKKNIQKSLDPFFFNPDGSPKGFFGGRAGPAPTGSVPYLPGSGLPGQQPPPLKLDEGGDKVAKSLADGAQKAAESLISGGSTGGQNLSDVVNKIPWASFGSAIAGPITAALSKTVNVVVSGAAGVANRGADTPVNALATAVPGGT